MSSSDTCQPKFRVGWSNAINDLQTGTLERSPSHCDTKAEDQKCKCDNQSARSEPMIKIPTALLCSPVVRKRRQRPLNDPFVDGHRPDQRKDNAETLNRDGD